LRCDYLLCRGSRLFGFGGWFSCGLGGNWDQGAPEKAVSFPFLGCGAIARVLTCIQFWHGGAPWFRSSAPDLNVPVDRVSKESECLHHRTLFRLDAGEIRFLRVRKDGGSIWQSSATVPRSESNWIAEDTMQSAYGSNVRDETIEQ
jgi:hypothetical protein